MTATVIDPAQVAQRYREEVRSQIAALGRGLRVVGLLSQTEGPAATYAEYAARGSREAGVDFEIWQVAPSEAAAAIARANLDPSVAGIFLYYPLVDSDHDRWLRELVDPRKDIEGMHSFWSRCLYENRRYLDSARTQRAILPCTPLAIVKLVEAAGLHELHPQTDPQAAAPLSGITACVINRSDIVGRPLAAMLANDGAQVVSLDVDSALIFEPAGPHHAHTVRSCDLTRADALASADVVITGVPVRDFTLVTGAEIKPGAICVNFSQFRNFDDSILDVAAAFVPRVGPMTVTMATRNLVRLATSVQGSNP